MFLVHNIGEETGWKSEKQGGKKHGRTGKHASI